MTVETSKRPPQNMMLIYVLYQILLFIGDTILLGGFKFVDEILDLLRLGAHFLGTAQMQSPSWMTAMNEEYRF